MTSNMKKNFIWNLLGATLYSFTSLFLMIIVTRVNGVDEAGIFTFSFSIACLFQVISNYFGRTFQVTSTDKNLFDSDFLYHRIFSCTLMLMVVFIYLLFQNYSSYKNIVIILWVMYRMFESFSEIFYAVLQKNDELYRVGVSLLLKAVLGTLIFWMVDYLSHNLLFSIVTFIFVSLFITLIYEFRYFKKYFHKDFFDKKKIKLLFVTGFFVFLFTFLVQYILNAPKYAIDGLMDDSAQTIYGIISMPATFMVLCSQLVIQPFLGLMTTQLQEKKYKDFLKVNFRIILFVILIGVIAEVICYFIGIPILEFIYGISLKNHLNSLLLIVIGAVFFGISYIVSTSLTTMRKTFIQAIIYIVISVMITICSRIFVNLFGVFGAAISYTLSMGTLGIVFLGVLIILIKKFIKKAEEKKL